MSKCTNTQTQEYTNTKIQNCNILDCSPIKLHDLCKEAADRLHTFDDASNSIDQMINAPKVQTCKIVQIVIIWSSENSKLQFFYLWKNWSTRNQIMDCFDGAFSNVLCILLTFGSHFLRKKKISSVMCSSISVGQPSAPGMNQVVCTLSNVQCPMYFNTRRAC